MRETGRKNEALREVLARCASELRLAAWSGLDQQARYPFVAVLSEFPPDWCKRAAAAFDAMDAIGQSPANFTSCHVLRPWVGA